MAHFNYDGTEDTCLWCGEKLKDLYGLQDYFNEIGENLVTIKQFEKDLNRSDYTEEYKTTLQSSLDYRRNLLNSEALDEKLKKYEGVKGINNLFCSKGCATNWAKRMAHAGYRLLKNTGGLMYVKRVR